jgi:hypothetical protein
MRVTLMLAAAAAALVVAEPASSADEAGRYRLERTDGGFVRMDTETGRMSFCTGQAGGLDCKAASDERPADTAEIDRLTRRVEALERRIAELETGKPQNALPTDEEFERTMGFMERFFRRFMGMMQDFQQEQKPGQPPTTTPNRT